MFNLFLYHISCQYWRFHASEKDKIIGNSFEKPLFLVAYSPYCGHCTNVPNESIIFRHNTDSRTDFYFSLINCAEGDACGHFNVPFTPYHVLVRGYEQDYWPEIKTNNATEWLAFVEEQLKPTARQISDLEEIESEKEKLIKGGSLFVLTVKNNASEYLSTFLELSKKYYIYQDLFLYRISPNEEQKLTVFTSNTCSHELKQMRKMTGFIDQYKFGSAHKYTREEIFSLIDNGEDMSIMFVEESYDGPIIADVQKKSLLQLGDQYCSRMKTGWASFKSGDDFLRENKMREEQMPVVYFRSKNCINKYFGRVYESYDTDYYNLSLNGGICNKIYDNIDGRERVLESDIGNSNVKQQWWQRKYYGKYLFYAIYAYFFFILFIAK